MTSNIEDCAAQFHELNTRHLHNIIQINKRYDFQEISAHEHYRLETVYENIHNKNVQILFDRLTWSEQIELYVRVPHPDILVRLDPQQISAARIMS